MSSYCKAMYCRYNKTHTTKGHKCGRCSEYGHGDFECSNNIRNSLIQYHEEKLPYEKQCTIDGCNEKEYHTIDAHHCSNCGFRDPHSLSECPKTKGINNNKTYYIVCPLCRANNVITKPKKIMGLSDICCVCQENNSMMLLNCDHCCLCLECFEKCDKNI